MKMYKRNTKNIRNKMEHKDRRRRNMERTKKYKKQQN